MADIDSLQLPDGSQYNVVDSTSDYATKGYVQDQIGTINKTTIGLGNVDNTSDANKPVSTAQQSALNEKLYSDVIADEESEFTASRRYEAGEQFIYQGALYKTTAIVPNGDPFEVDVNVELSDDILTQLSGKQDTLELDSETVTGTSLSFNTDSEQVVQNTVITFEPIQAGSGDPSPSNVRAISGYDEIDVLVPRKNWFDGTYLNAIFSATGTPNIITFASNSTGRTAMLPIAGGQTYHIHKNSGDRFAVVVTNKKPVIGTNYSRLYLGQDTDTDATVTIPDGMHYMLVYVDSANSIEPQMQVELGSTATTYESYNPITDISIKLNETIYSGTLDVESGKLVVDKAIVDLGDVTWVKTDAESSSWRYYTLLANLPLVDKTTWQSWICTHAPANNLNEGSTVGFFAHQTFNVLQMNLGSAIGTNNTPSFKTYCANNNVKLVYKLATPITIQLPPAQVKLLQGANVVTTNGTSMSLTYRNGEVAKLSDLSGLADSINADVVKTSNRNLLDNPWFTINQRGLSTYSGGSQYTVDRWKYDYVGSTSSIGVSSSGITLNNTSTYTFIEQKFESVSNLLNRPLTASILFSNGTIKSGTAIYDGTASVNFLPTIEDVRLQMSYPANSFRVVSYSSSPVTIRAVKLELGSHSTLHLDTAPDYTTELLKCQRYFYRVLASADTPLIALGYAIDATRTRLSILLPTKMRLTQPTITYSGTIQVLSDESTHTITGVNSVQISNGNIQPLTINTTGLTVGHFCTMLLSNSAYIDISADL